MEGILEIKINIILSKINIILIKINQLTLLSIENKILNEINYNIVNFLSDFVL